MSPSSSVAATVPTTVLLAVFSAMVNVWEVTSGASFTSVRLMVMGSDSRLAPSHTPTVNANVVVVS